MKSVTCVYVSCDKKCIHYSSLCEEIGEDRILRKESNQVYIHLWVYVCTHYLLHVLVSPILGLLYTSKFVCSRLLEGIFVLISGLLISKLILHI